MPAVPRTPSILLSRANWSCNVSHTVSNRSIARVSAPSDGSWLTPDRLPRVRSVLLGVTLFTGLLVWIAFSLGVLPRGTHLIAKLRIIGVMTWVYALVQAIDMKVWRSRFAQRRRASSRIPEVLEGWLFGQMIAWFGIAYYALTDDPWWFVGGLLLFVLSFIVFPVRDER